MNINRLTNLFEFFYFSGLWKNRFIRFIVIGAVNSLVGYFIYSLLLFVGLNYVSAFICSSIIGIVFGFKTQSTFVFNNPNNRLFWRFILFWIVIYGINIVLIGGIMSFGWNAYEAGALAIPPTALISYLAQKYLVFRRPITL